MVFAISGGLNHVYIVWQSFGLIWVTMVMGHFAEVINRPISRGDEVRPYYWLINARFQRLYPHLLGYVPYLFFWVPLLHSFFWNVQDAPGGGPPDFVYAVRMPWAANALLAKS